MSAADVAVYKFVLGKSDYVTAELGGKFTPTRDEIRRKTHLSLRQVNYSIRHLERHGWLAVSGATGRGHRPDYKLGSGAGCDCTGRVHAPERVQPDALKGAPVAPFAVQPKGATPQVNGRFPLDGSNREGEEEPPWTDPKWPRHPDGRKLSFAEIMAAHGSDPWA